MSKLILLDTGPLGLISNPKPAPLAQAARAWMHRQQQQGHLLIVPEIADYEVRRELLRAGKINGLHRLDLVKATLSYLPLTTKAMLRAAQLWAQARNSGQPTANDAALDCDVILAAQASLLLDEGSDTVVATSNLRHLSGLSPQWIGKVFNSPSHAEAITRLITKLSDAPTVCDIPALTACSPQHRQ